ncbi:diguanylate cyclase, partial [Aduncisulcus paluster]
MNQNGSASFNIASVIGSGPIRWLILGGAQLDDLEVVQRDLIAFMRDNGIATAENYRRRMSSADIHAMLKSKMDALSNVGSLNVFDADGALINSSGALPLPQASIADRDYFNIFKSSPYSPDMMVAPVVSRVSGNW